MFLLFHWDPDFVPPESPKAGAQCAPYKSFDRHRTFWRERKQEMNKYLLLDTRITERARNAKLVVTPAEKDSRNPLFGEDKPWEQRFDNLYPNVMYDRQEGLYKCWYSPFISDLSAKGIGLAGARGESIIPRRDGRWGCAMPLPRTVLRGTSRN